MSYTMDEETRRGYDIPDGYRGFAVIQHGYACLGTGDSEAEAIADAVNCTGEPIDDSELVANDYDRQDGSIEVVEV